MKKTDKILVTGASGFIGSRLLKMLYENGYTNLRATTFARDLRNDFTGTQFIEHIKGDLQTAEFCEKIVQNIDVVFHCAANTSNALDTKVNPLIHVTANVEMNVNLMEQAWKNKVRKFMYISSNTVYPDLGNDYCYETENCQTPDIFPVYKAVGNMKRYGETLCDFLSNHIHNPMQCVIIRPSNAFGPNDKYDYEKCHVTPANIRKVADNLNPIPVWGDGSELRDLLYVSDFVDALQIIMENEKEMFEVYNVGSNKVYSVLEVLDLMKTIAQHNAPIEFISGKPSMIPTRKIDSNKIKEKLGWEAKTSLTDGLSLAYNWYNDNKDEFNK